MKAISLWQPYASLMQTGAKRIETRSWETKYRGKLLICSAKGGITKRELRYLLSIPSFKAGLFSQYGTEVEIKDLPFGMALCVVDLIGIRPTHKFNIDISDPEFSFGDYSRRRFAWITKNQRLIKPFPVTGRQRLFNVSDERIKYI